ncbi:HXXEE domain-containing protein [Flavitalea sp.]|nr:HXXEE domain-containing protein [Flavitalea sp.]
MFTFSTLALLLPVAIFFHVTEEFLVPGGFIEWYQKFVPSKTKGIQPGYLVWINTLMIGVCVLPFYFDHTPAGIAIWYCISLSTAVNACFHIWGVIKMKMYSPGVLTGVLLYIPLFIIGSMKLLSPESVSLRTIVVCTAAAIGYHILSVIRQAR